MHLESLTIRRFRNLRQVRLDLAPGVHLLWGENAQGKTNILEAVYYLVTGRSFRTRFDREVLPLDGDNGDPGRASSVVEGAVRRAATRNELRIVITSEGKQVLADGKPLDRLGLLWGRLNAVLFTPADLELVQGGPAVRRRFLDTELAQIDPTYLASLQRFDRALRQRNALLRRAGRDAAHRPGAFRALRGHLVAYEKPLAEEGAMLTLRRARGLAFLSGRAAGCYREIGGAREELRLEYRPSMGVGIGEQGSGVGERGEEEGEAQQTGAGEGEPDLRRPIDPAALADLTERYRRRLEESSDLDLRRGQTVIGPHRDDFHFRLDGRNARDFGSQGQQRSCVLALRLAEIELMRRATGENPVLLLDDIVSELDERRRAALLRTLPEGVQTIMTATNAEPLGGYLGPAPRFHIHGGEVRSGEAASPESGNDPEPEKTKNR